MTGTIDKQIEIEERRKEETIQRYLQDTYKNLNNGSAMETTVAQVLLKLGHPLVARKIQEYIDTPTTGTRKKDKDTLLNMCDDPKVLSYITLHTLLQQVMTHDNRVTIAGASSAVMRHIHSESLVERLRRSDPKMFKYMDSAYRRASKRRKEQMMKTHITNLQERADLASTKVRYSTTPDTLRIGVTLIDCVIASGAGLFATGMVTERGKRSNIVYLTQQGKEIMTQANASAIAHLASTYPPMIVPPKPWTNNRDGGLLTKRMSIIKSKTPAGHKLVKHTEIPKLYPVINRLQNTEWRVNRFVLDVVDAIFRDNMLDPRSPRNLPRLYGGLPTNTVSEPEDIIHKESYGALNEEGLFEDQEAFKRWRRDHESVKIALDGELGRRLQLIAALGEAKEFADYDKLWFAYTLDSRGRVYTIQSVLGPQSNSTVKAMLEFANGQYLNEAGVYWLKIHTANVNGQDKEDFPERIAWFEEHEDEIIRCGRDPLGNIGAWAYCDSPFEYLAACRAYVDHLGGKPVHIGIQLDATNSGVQIYSGLLGDLAGAKTVNVVNTGRRADVYRIVADKVNTYLEEGHYPATFEVMLSDGDLKIQTTHVEAESIKGKITRKIVKRNVMTVPYSVSKRGMSNQLWDIIDEAKLTDTVWWEGDPWVVNKLLTDLNHEAIYDTIEGAKMGQDYLVALAELCNEKDGMVYYTPLYEIPVVQKRPRTETNTVQTLLGTLNIRSNIPDSLDKMAQKNGSAPNYIHSVDSTILLRVIETMPCQIGVIHDCFIVPPNEGYVVQDRFKHAYVEIMQMRPLELLGAQLDPEGTIPVPYIGTLDLNDVFDAEYIIS